MTVTVSGRPRLSSQVPGCAKFCRKSDIDEIARNGDVVWLLVEKVAYEPVENLAPMLAAAAIPIDIAKGALADQLVEGTRVAGAQGVCLKVGRV